MDDLQVEELEPRQLLNGGRSFPRPPSLQPAEIRTVMAGGGDRSPFVDSGIGRAGPFGRGGPGDGRGGDGPSRWAVPFRLDGRGPGMLGLPGPDPRRPGPSRTETQDIVASRIVTSPPVTVGLPSNAGASSAAVALAAR